MRTTLLLIAVATFVLPPGTGAEAQSVGTVPDHSTFTRFLAEVVVFPRVDYERVLQNRSGLDDYLRELAETPYTMLEQASREEQLAFWINAYNACMLQIVADHYPLERGNVPLFQRMRNLVTRRPENSVWWIPDVFEAPFCEVAGASRSLDEIEHEIIRPRYEEPRIHFAVNCAAVSCPPLWPEAYVPSRLEEQLERATRQLMDDPEHFVLEGSSPATLRVNRVLDWFGEDFEAEEGIKRFFAQRLSGAYGERILAADTRVEFFDYDWTLNDVDP